MLKRKLAISILAVTVANLTSTPIKVLANELQNVTQLNSQEMKVGGTESNINKSRLFGSDKSKADLENEKSIVECGEVRYIDTEVSSFIDINSALLPKYDKEYKVDSSEITSITNNGGHYGSNTIDKAIDGDVNTNWHSGKQNSSKLTNEVVITLEEVTTLNRIVYTVARSSNRGFPEAFDIYTSKTSNGDNFEVVSSGTAEKTQDSLQFKFNPTEFKRVKFVFKKGFENWAVAAEIGLYKEDVISDKMDRLFTDSTMSKVSEEFNSIEKLNELDGEVKNHPLYENFKENIDNAKILVNNNAQDSDTKAKVSRADVYGTELQVPYDKVFRMDNSNIAAIKNNGGQYGSSEIKNAIDNDVNTHWETGKPNSESFTNEVEFELKDTTTLNRIVYKARNGGKGFAKEFEIYGSKTSKGDTFNLVSAGAYTNIGDTIEIEFEPTEFKRIKFKFKNAHQNWASASEFAFYAKDTLPNKINTVFTDGTMTALTDEFNSEEAVNALINEIKEHPLGERYKNIGDLAKDILENPNKYENANIVTASQNGHYDNEAHKRGLNSGTFSLDSFGMYVVPGETISLYVDADENGIMPNLILGQVGNNIANWRMEYQLKPGLNVITTPDANRTRPAAVYICNNALPTEQAYAPRVRLEGGTSYPVYRHGETNPQEFRKELEEYNKKVSINDEDFINGPRTDVFYNITELTSKNVNIATTAKGALKGLQEIDQYGEDVSKTMDDWELMYEDFQTYSGLDPNSKEEIFTPYQGKLNNRVYSSGAHAWAGVGQVGYNGGSEGNRDEGFYKGIVQPFNRSDNWANTHEWGHKFNNNKIIDGEVTNNLYAQRIRRIMGIDEIRVPWDKLFTRFSGEEVNMHYFEKLGVLSQVEAYFGEYVYAKASRLSQTNGSEMFKGLDGGENPIPQNRLIIALSFASGYDLTDFFEEWNYSQILDLTKERVSSLPKLKANIQYIDSSVYGYKGEGFVSEEKTEITEIKKDTKNKINILSFKVDDTNKDHLLGYEVYRDGELVGYTRKDTFADKNVDSSKNYSYKIVAFDKKLNTIESEELKVFRPILSVEENVTLKLNSEYNPMDYVNSTTHDGKDISEKVVVKSNNVNTRKKGLYEVVYEVISDEATVTKTSKVEVTSDYAYASDMKEVSAKVGWGTFQKDKNPSGSEIGLYRNGYTAKYKKGIGAHANSEVVYNVENQNFDFFESYIGVDQTMTGKKSSATFEVWVDGEKKYESGVFRHNTEHEFVKIPVSGAKEVKLMTRDNNDSNSSDQTVWAEAKFTINSSKPELNIPGSLSTKVGESIDLGIYSAYDIEDGDLTDSVIVEGTVDFNKSGEYTLTYKVKDSDENETIKTRTVAVVNMGDYNYLTNYDWKSANTSYGEVRKDKSSSNGNLKLTDENGKEVAYEKGLGTHSTSNVVYDLSDKNYDYFTSYVGVDRAVYGSVGSVLFQVLVDGVVKYYSGVMRSTDPQKYVEVDINGAKELKLVVTGGGNGNGSDHGTWGDTKLHSAKTNSMPVIEIPNNVSIKLNEEYNLMEGVKATDEEDGDITTNVVIDKGDFTTSKSGEYIIKYTITDSAGNSTSKESTIIVYNDEKYISDVEWESAKTTFKDVKKDTSLGGGKIKLNIDGKETIFKKGLGTHANAEIVYDVENINYEYFETYVGIDRNIKEQDKSSVIFKIFADDVEVYNSGVMKWSDDAKLARVSLKGISKLTLVANDAGNGRESDHSLFANSRFLATVAIDRSNLDALLKEIEELQESNYISETWNNLMAVKEKVNASLSDGYNQKEIDTLYE